MKPAMPRYLFPVSDGAEFPTPEEVVLPDISAARIQAIETAGAMLREHGPTFWGGGECRMTVADQSGETVCSLRFSVE